MTTFDSVAPDVPVLLPVSAKVFRYVQTWAPFALHGLAVFCYLVVFLFEGRSIRHTEAKRGWIFAAVVFVLTASFLRRLSPYLVGEVGSYRYDRVASVVTRLLPNTRQSWIVVMTLAALAFGLPLYLYLYTHFTHSNTVYGFAMFWQDSRSSSTFIVYCGMLLITALAMAVCYGLVALPLGGRNPIYVAEPTNRTLVFIRLISWLALTMLLMVLFCFSRLLLCNGPMGRYKLHGGPGATCGTGMHFIATLFGWFVVAAAYVGLDVGMAYVRLLGGGTVGYYALEPRLDGLFSELLVWVLKVTVAMATFTDPIAADLVTALLFTGLFIFTWFRRTSTVEVLEELIRWSVFIVAATTFVSLCLTSRSIPAAVPAVVILLCWVAAVAGSVTLYLRRFGFELFGSGREVTADIIIL